MRFTSNAGIAESEIISFESQIGFALPDDYRAFLRRCNGGWFTEGWPELSVDTVSTVYLQALFGIGINAPALNLGFWHQEMIDDLLPNSLLIGKDPGGAFLLLCCGSEPRGLYLYDHSYRYPASSDARNTYFIASGFDGVMAAAKGLIPS